MAESEPEPDSGDEEYHADSRLLRLPFHMLKWRKALQMRFRSVLIWLIESFVCPLAEMCLDGPRMTAYG